MRLSLPLTLETIFDHMVLIEGGTFTLGGMTNVTLNDFTLCRFPVTQQLYEQVLGENPSYFRVSERPVERVNWYEAIVFCNMLSKITGLTPFYNLDRERKDPNNKSPYDELKWTVSYSPQANGYRLPTEADWKFAAQGGIYSRNSEYAGSQFLEEVGWYDGNSGGETHPIGQLLPNELGLYDMSGNVWEWCWDWHGDNLGQPQYDPVGPIFGTDRLICGGSWSGDKIRCRIASRDHDLFPGYRGNDVGFRIARTL
jgi:sulfatase modifying factor 1